MTEGDRLSFRGAKRRGNPFHFQRGTGRRVVGPYALFGARDAARRGRRALRGTRRGVVTPPYGAFLVVHSNGTLAPVPFGGRGTRIAASALRASPQ